MEIKYYIFAIGVFGIITLMIIAIGYIIRSADRGSSGGGLMTAMSTGIPNGYRIYRRCEACKLLSVKADGESHCNLFSVPVDVNAVCDGYYPDKKRIDALITKAVEERFDQVEKELKYDPAI